MLVTLLYVLFFISCLLLIGAILLQPGKADAGALFTSSISSTAFGARGTQSVLSKVTIGIAAAYMVTALLLSMNAVIGNNSIMQGSEGITTQPSTSTATLESQQTANQNTNAVVPAAAPTADAAANSNK